MASKESASMSEPGDWHEAMRAGPVGHGHGRWWSGRCRVLEARRKSGADVMDQRVLLTLFFPLEEKCD